MDFKQEVLDRHVAQDEAASRQIAEARRVLPARKRVTGLVILSSLGVIVAQRTGVYSFGIWLPSAYLALLLAVAVLSQTALACTPRAHIADYRTRPLAVSCPVCSTPPGEWCANGMPTALFGSRTSDTIHGDRWQAYLAAREKIGHPSL